MRAKKPVKNTLMRCGLAAPAVAFSQPVRLPAILD